MHVKKVGEETMHLEPKTQDEGILCQMLFERITERHPDLTLVERAELSMSLFEVVKQWAHDTGDTKLIVED